MEATGRAVFKREQHRDLEVLSVYMSKNSVLNTIAKELSATYSSTKKMWWLPRSKQIVNTAYRAFKGSAWVDCSSIDTSKETVKSTSVAVVKQAKKSALKNFPWTQVQKDAMWAFADKLHIRKYSQSAFDTYGYYFKQFLAAYPDAEPKGDNRRTDH